MRRLIKVFIKNTFWVNLLILLIFTFGIIAGLRINSSFFPKQDTKFIKIEAYFPGASPEEMEKGVTLKIEDNLQGVSGIDRVTSVSRENQATVTVELLSSANADVVLQDVKNAVDQISSFPPQLERVVVFKQEILNFTALLALNGDVPLQTLKERAQRIEDDLRLSDNISKISLGGFTQEEIEVSLDETKMRTYEITFDEVAQVIRNTNLETTGGTIRGENRELIIRADNKEYYADKLGNMIIRAQPDGNVVRLRDIATLKDKWEENTDKAFYNQDRAIFITINTLNRENILKAAEYVQNYVGEFNKDNSKLSLEVIDLGTTSLNDRISLLAKNGTIGLVLVLLVLAAFLRLRLAFWVALGIPVSFLGMIILSAFAGITINVLSLFGMILVVGILVDDGIVVGENIFQHYEDGKDPEEAALDGTMQVMPSILAAILTTSVAFSFFFFLEGQLGEYYSDVSFVVIAALGFSLIEVILFLPSHLSHSKDLQRDYKPHKIKKKIENALLWVRDKIYQPLLNFIWNNKIFYTGCSLAFLILVFALVPAGLLRTTFFPELERNTVTVSLEMPAGTSEDVTRDLMLRIANNAEKLNKEEYQEAGTEEDDIDGIIRYTTVTVGPQQNQGKATIYLTAAENREIRSFTVASDLREMTGEVPQARNLSFETSEIFGKPISISLSGRDYDELREASTTLKDELRKMDRVEDVVDTYRESRPEVEIQLKDKARLLGLTLGEVMNQIRSAFFGQEVQRLQRGNDEIKVWVRYPLKNRRNREQLKDMRIRLPDSSFYPVNELVKIIPKEGPVAINHRNGRREISVEADMASLEASPVEALRYVESSILPQILEKYPGVDYQLEGQVRQTQKLQRSAAQVGPVILILMLALLVFTFKSYSQTFALLFVIPFGIAGAMLGHWIHALPVSVLSVLGFVAMIGILVNDGLVFINTFNDNLDAGGNYEKSIKKTGMARFRPLVLTTITTSAGLGPLIFETSFQAQFLKPMAASVAYGLIFGTFFIATMLPVTMAATNKFKVWVRWLWTGTKPERKEMERTINQEA